MHTSLGPLFSLRSLLLAALLAFPALAAAQANANYTADYPSVDRVRAEIKGSSPTDTLARQAGVLTYLAEEIKRIASNRSMRAPWMPEEARLINAYNLAAYQISQDFKKSHTPAEFADFDRLQFNYTIDGNFRRDWTKRLIGAQGQAAYTGTTSDLAARQQAHVEAIKRQNEEAEAAAKRNSRNADGLSNDPTSVTTRRCLELGGGPLTCLGKGIGSGMLGLIGFDPESITGPGPAGVILSGSYAGPHTGTSLQFNSASVAISNCGKLVPDGHHYTIAKAPGSLLLHVDNSPQNFTLTMRPDGGLTGPGLVTVDGRIIIGYHTITHTLYVNGRVATPAECNGPCVTTETIPDYAPKTERCTIGSYTPPPPVKEASTAPVMSDGMTAMANLLTGGIAHAEGPPALPLAPTTH